MEVINPASEKLYESPKKRSPCKNKTPILVVKSQNERQVTASDAKTGEKRKLDSILLGQSLILEDQPVREALAKIANASPTDANEVKAKKPRLESDILQLLECSACQLFPRDGRIFNCDNGHPICGKCHPKLDKCPMCRSLHFTSRNRLAERLLHSTLSKAEVKCVNELTGCKMSGIFANLQRHENVCVYREVHCPAYHRKACNWVGTLKELYIHLNAKKCTQIIKQDEEELPFTSVIGDFLDDATVFERKSMTHWKPVMLVTRHLFRLFAYLVMSRAPSGDWFLYVRVMAGQDVVDRVVASIVVRSPKSDESSAQAQALDLAKKGQDAKSIKGQVQGHDGRMTELEIPYEGGVNSYEALESEVLKSGNFLTLSDEQVKRLKNGKTLLEYEVDLKLKEDYIQKVMKQ